MLRWLALNFVLTLSLAGMLACGAESTAPVMPTLTLIPTATPTPSATPLPSPTPNLQATTEAVVEHKLGEVGAIATLAPTRPVDQPRFEEGKAVVLVRQWLITAGCTAYYNDVDEWHHQYLGGGDWKVVAHFTDGMWSRWRVHEGTTAVDLVDTAFVGVC